MEVQPVPGIDSPLSDRVADAFGPVTLGAFAQNPARAHLFRVQHEVLLTYAAKLMSFVEPTATAEAALQARLTLTTLSSLMPIHQSLEEAVMRSVLSGEPSSRMLVEQFERDMAPLAHELAALGQRYPTASSICRAPQGEVAIAVTAFVTRLTDRMRREERELFPALDRNLPILPATAAP